MKKDILCIGAGYIGGPTMAVIAAKNPDRKVTVVDINADRIAAWNSDTLPIYEPGLKELVEARRGKNLFFTTDLEKGIRENDIIFVGVNTPTKTFGRGAGYAADLQYWEKTACDIARYAQSDKLVIEKSTLPVRTAAAMAKILNEASQYRFEVLSNPEFLAEGTAIRDLLEPDRVLCGGNDTPLGRIGLQELIEIYAAWVPRERILTTNVWSSELSKLAANAFLAQRISSINALTELCEQTGADIDEVAHAVGLDTRIGSKFLKAGVGFGGSCFKKDILNLSYICESHGLYQAAAYWKQVVEVNEFQQERFVRRIVDEMFGTLAGKKVAVLGFAFKADTGDTREAPAKKICHILAEEHASIAVSDPKALSNAERDLADIRSRVTFCADPYEAAKGAHAVVVLTDWPEYRGLDYARIYASMAKPAFLFDGRNCLDLRALAELGFKAYGVGKVL
ncbi:MAG: nucleotide sugar dehydrogenase [Kiritimatiellia bacterium]